MNKAKINYIVDMLMLLSFIVTAFTGIILFFFLPSGVRQGQYQTFLGIIKATWITLHDWAGILMILLVLLHFVLHWKWIVYMTKSMFRKKQKCDE